MTSAPLTRDDLAQRDDADPLRRFQDAFEMPDGVLYLDGNSLGALPKATISRMARVVDEEWGRDLIRSWTANDWIDMPARIGDKIARIVGAKAGEVAVADSTSVNLFKLLAAALRLRPERRVILTEDGNFPTDIYIAQGLIDLLGQTHTLRRVAGGDLERAVDEDTAAVMVTHVNYQTGAMHDLAALTAAAQAHDALMLWDLSHSVGAVPVDLNGGNADFAVGCGYKYLNGGPGAPAFLFIAERHHESVRPPLAGWMGHAAPFEFEGDYRPASGIVRNLAGTPPILSMAALEEGVDLFLRADMSDIRQKSTELTEAFIQLIGQECFDAGIAVASPSDPGKRGSQVSLRHPNGYAIIQALIARGVIGDFRTPDVMRFGFAPLYLRHVDVWDAVAVLKDILETRAWDRPEFQARAAVT